MNQIKVLGTQQFMGKEIPVVSGGFGENCKVVTDKMVAEIHGITESDVRKAINRNINRFKENIDFIDFKSTRHEMTSKEMLSSLGYSDVAIRNAKNIYLLSERGYAKLIKIMDTDLAWEIHDKLIDEYFTMRDVIQSEPTLREKLLLKLFSNDPMEVASAHKQLVAIETKPLVETIEKQKPLVEMCLKRRSSEGLVTLDDIRDTFNLKKGQVGTWLRMNGYVHYTRNEVNEKGKGLVRVYGEEYPSIGITEDGVKFIDEHIKEIKMSPCRKPKKSA